MRRLDYWTDKEFHIDQAMRVAEAGRLLADFIRVRFPPAKDDLVLVLAGKDQNAAIALAAGRRLLHRGGRVEARTCEPPTKMLDVARRELARFRKEGGTAPPQRATDTLPPATLLLDGILGYGLTQTSKGPAAELMTAADGHGKHHLAVDIPSGLDPDTGEAGNPTFKADATLVLGFVKPGVLEASAKKYVGELYLADVGYPRSLYEDFDVAPESLFGDAEIVRL